MGSILVVTAFLIQVIAFNAFGLLHIEADWILEFDIVAGCFIAMAIWRHRANFVRLCKGTENKLGQKAK